MHKTAGESNGFPAALVSENRKRVKQKTEYQERAPGVSCTLNRVFHGKRVHFHEMIPKSMAAR
jgi:hypothetical protein